MATALTTTRHRTSEGNPVLLAGCWAHTRRAFYEALGSCTQRGRLDLVGVLTPSAPITRVICRRFLDGYSPVPYPYNHDSLFWQSNEFHYLPRMTQVKEIRIVAAATISANCWYPGSANHHRSTSMIRTKVFPNAISIFRSAPFSLSYGIVLLSSLDCSLASLSAEAFSPTQ